MEVGLVRAALVKPTIEAEQPRFTREPVLACVAVGANLGDAVFAVTQAINHLGKLPNTEVVKASSSYRTAPWQAKGPDYINAVAVVLTRLTAPDLLSALQTLEAEAGRQRPYINAPRTLDLDLLLYGSSFIDTPRLTVPHPRMWERAFVVVPLAEVAPQLVTPEALQAVAKQRIERLSPSA